MKNRCGQTVSLIAAWAILSVEEKQGNGGYLRIFILSSLLPFFQNVAGGKQLTLGSHAIPVVLQLCASLPQSAHRTSWCPCIWTAGYKLKPHLVLNRHCINSRECATRPSHHHPSPTINTCASFPTNHSQSNTFSWFCYLLLMYLSSQAVLVLCYYSITTYNAVELVP